MVAVIFAGGEPVSADVLEDLPADAFVIAADSGLDQARALGIAVDLLVGDLDSASVEGLAAARDVPTELHPREKDATDLELALDTAARLEADRVMIVGGYGKRLDHLLANAQLLTSPRYAALDVEWLAGPARVHAVHGSARLHGSPGELVSLLAVGGPATGIRTSGLRWALDGETLEPGSTRGVSNEFTSPIAMVSVTSGTLLAVIPGLE